MNPNNLPIKSSSHIVTGSWLVYNDTNNETIRLHSNSFGQQSIYINDKKVENFRTFKSSFEHHFENNGNTYAIKMNTESYARAENVFTFHKNEKILRIFKTQFKFSFLQTILVIVPIIFISSTLTAYDYSNLFRYSSVFLWFILAIILTGKNYLQITESNNPDFG